MNERNKEQKNPQQNPSKAMDSKKEVEQSPDPKTDQDFPGYPHYPAKEDIMDKRTESHRVDADVENFPTSANRTGVSQRFLSSTNENEEVASTGYGANDQLDITDSEEDEIGKRHNVSNEEINERHQVLDDIETLDDDTER